MEEVEIKNDSPQEQNPNEIEPESLPVLKIEETKEENNKLELLKELKAEIEQLKSKLDKNNQEKEIKELRKEIENLKKCQENSEKEIKSLKSELEKLKKTDIKLNVNGTAENNSHQEVEQLSELEQFKRKYNIRENSSEIEIYNKHIGDKGVKLLFEIPQNRIRTLNLYGNDIKDIKFLSNIKVENMERLYLYNNKMIIIHLVIYQF